MAKAFLIMCENTPVMSINFNEGIYDILCEELLPFTLKGKIRYYDLAGKDTYTKYDLTQIRLADSDNKDAITSWLANRTLSLSRKNAKWIYNLLMLDQLNNEIEKAKVAIICRAVSVVENYWLK